MTLFYEILEKGIDDPRGMLTRLIKYTEGDAKEMIKQCLNCQHKILGMQKLYWSRNMVIHIIGMPQVENGFQKFLKFLGRV